LFLIMGGVDFNWRDTQNRVTFDGHLATIPIVNTTKHGPIRDVLIAHEETLPAIADRMSKTYRGAKYPYAKRLEGLIETMKMMESQASLMMVNVMLHRVVAELLRIHTKTVVDTAPTAGETTTERLTALILRYDDAPVYYAGSGAKNYLMRYRPSYPVMVQYPRTDLCQDSVVQVIATEPDPTDYVMSAATWSPL
jgi:hypothetical protein